MMKRMIALLLSLSVLLSLCSCAGAADTPKILDFTAGLDRNSVVSYAFSAPGQRYLTLKYDSGSESGTIVLEGVDGAFSGKLPLRYNAGKQKLTLTISSLSQKALYKWTQPLESVGFTPLADNEKAVSRVTDLALTPIPGGIAYRFTASGRSSVVLSFRSVSQKGRLVAYPDNGVYSGEILLPYAHASDLVTVELFTTAKNKAFGKASARLPFTDVWTDDAPPPGPLSGVKVCLDPGHQAQKALTARVLQYPGSTKRVSGGSSGMAQGKATLRKESVVALEIAYQTARALKAQGATVYMTRWIEDTTISNMARAEYANEVGADYFIRIHLNMSSKKTADGIFVYCPKNSDYARAACSEETYHALAEALLAQIVRAVDGEHGYCRYSDQFIANNWAKMPAFLLELGYMSTPRDDLLASFPPYQARLAEGITRGVIEMEKLASAR